jgi:hypothetical protein
MAADPVTDLRDLRVLIPATRRAIDGPQATGSAAPSTTLTDEMVLNIIADATGELILLTAGSLGYTLEVMERDDSYMAPIAWQTDKERTPDIDALITSQAAINYHFRRLVELKSSETMRDKDGEWSYTLSANVLRDWLKELAKFRDEALAALGRVKAPLDTYVSTVTERDRWVARIVEPWVEGIGGLGGATLGDPDYRFGTMG